MILGIKDGARRQEDALQVADVLGQQAAQTRPHGLEENQLFFLENGNMLDVRQRLEFFDVELGAIKALFYVFGIAVGIGQKIFQLNEAVLTALAFIEYFSAAVDPFGAIFTGHTGHLGGFFQIIPIVRQL